MYCVNCSQRQGLTVPVLWHPLVVSPFNPEGMGIGGWVILFFENFEGMGMGMGMGMGNSKKLGA